MKYEDTAYNLSAQFYKDEDDDNIEVDDQTQCELLPILLKKFAEELEKDDTQNKGIVKVRFKQAFWQPAEPGYHVLRELVDAKKFDEFGSQFCFYLGNVERECNEYRDAYIEIIWDYKTYFEYARVSQLDSKDNSNNVAKLSLKGNN